MNPKIYKFLTEIKKVPDIDGAYVEVPYDIKTEFGKAVSKSTPPLTGWRITEALSAWADMPMEVRAI